MVFCSQSYFRPVLFTLGTNLFIPKKFAVIVLVIYKVYIQKNNALNAVVVARGICEVD